jgi:hypothetical protein
VFHVYDARYFIFPPGIINHELPDKNKYTNFKNIETICYRDVSTIKFDRLVNFVKTHFLQNNDNIFAPSKQNIAPYFYGHNTTSFVSFYNEPILMLDTKKGTTIDEQKTIGVMTSRPTHVSIKDGHKSSTFDAYYVDYLCVDKSYRKKGIAPQIIQTHHYNQCHKNPDICVSIFKREGELTGIVPLCVYTTYGFSVDKWTKPTALPAAYKILEINPQNYHLLLDFIKNTSHMFDIVVETDVANIIELIKTKNIFISVILFHDTILSAYFFRKSCVFVERNVEVLTCFASINKCPSNEFFVQGFKISFWKIADDNKFGFSAIENISHNKTIIDNLSLKTHPTVKSPTAYFFYNFAHPSFQADKVFVLT